MVERAYAENGSWASSDSKIAAAQKYINAAGFVLGLRLVLRSRLRLGMELRQSGDAGFSPAGYDA